MAAAMQESRPSNMLEMVRNHSVCFLECLI
jgi:hypothetical protein